MSFDVFLWSLFTSSFISSTLLPGGSEALLVWGIKEFEKELWPIVLVATAGNSLGALVTYGLGRFIPNKIDNKKLEFVKKWGVVTLLFSWLPVVGDGFCLAAGWLRLNFLTCSVMIIIGKFLRYIFLALAALKLFTFLG